MYKGWHVPQDLRPRGLETLHSTTTPALWVSEHRGRQHPPLAAHSSTKCKVTPGWAHVRRVKSCVVECVWSGTRFFFFSAAGGIPGIAPRPAGYSHDVTKGYQLEEVSRPRRNRRSPVIRSFMRETSMTPANFIAPFFIHDDDFDEEISAMPGCYRCVWWIVCMK